MLQRARPQHHRKPGQFPDRVVLAGTAKLLCPAIDQLTGNSAVGVFRSLNADVERVALRRFPRGNILVEILNPAGENLDLLVRPPDRVANPVLRLVVLRA